jgi:Zn-dependent protease
MTESSRCCGCSTELAPSALACPACGGLVHAGELRTLALTAEDLAKEGRLGEARDAWDRALNLLPPGSAQHQQISKRVVALTHEIAATPAAAEPSPADSAAWWKRGAAGGLAVAGLFLGKLKFLGFGLLKMQTLFSMLAFLGVYWTTYGWPLACGLVISIYIHEMGHVSELRRFGVAANAPLFVPGVGAFVLLKQHIDDPIVDARIGLAGPLWGLGAGAAAFAISVLTGSPTWGAIAELTGFINLFNLIPIWQLDGSRGFHALSNVQRLTIVAASALAFFATGQKLLILLGLVAAFRAFQSTTTADGRTFATFVALIAALSWLARSVG